MYKNNKNRLRLARVTFKYRLPRFYVKQSTYYIHKHITYTIYLYPASQISRLTKDVRYIPVSENTAVLKVAVILYTVGLLNTAVLANCLIYS